MKIKKEINISVKVYDVKEEKETDIFSKQKIKHSPMKMLRTRFVTITLSFVMILSCFVPSMLSYAASGDTIVYKTKSGECYHKDGCSSLSKSKIEITLQKAVDSGLRACSKCKP